jgi:hypothetical protein
MITARCVLSLAVPASFAVIAPPHLSRVLHSRIGVERGRKEMWKLDPIGMFEMECLEYC